MATQHEDEKVFHKAATFLAPVVFGDTVTFDGQGESPEFNLANLVDLSMSGKATAADVEATDDLTVGDDASIGGDLTVAGAVAVTGDYTSAAGNLTLTSGTMTAEHLASTDDAAIADDLTVGGDLAVTGDYTSAAGSITLTAGKLTAAEVEATTLTLPDGAFTPQWYISQEIVTEDLSGGAATEAVALTGLPTGVWYVLAAEVHTGDEVGSGSGDTTGLSIEVGHTGGDTDALVKSTDIFGAAGEKAITDGDSLGTKVDLEDDLAVLFTASGGSADTGDITGLKLKVALLLRPAPAIEFSE